jgi:transcription initiation factor TFIID subunit 10
MSTDPSTAQAVSTPQEQTSASTAVPQPAEQSKPNGPATTTTAEENKEVQDQSEAELNKLFTAKREEDMARRDRTLAEFLVMLDGYKPLVGPSIHLSRRD